MMCMLEKSIHMKWILWHRIKGNSIFQVALTVRDENTLLRELRPLQAIRDHYPKIILTMDEEPEEQYEGIDVLMPETGYWGL